MSLKSCLLKRIWEKIVIGKKLFKGTKGIREKMSGNPENDDFCRKKMNLEEKMENC